MKRARDSIPTHAARIFDINRDSKADMVSHFQTEGYVVLGTIKEKLCHKIITEQIKHIFLKQPWETLLTVHDPQNPSRVLDIDADNTQYIKAITSRPLSDAMLKHLYDVAPFHSGFGACCDPQAFHLPSMWTIRQNERLYEAASALLGGKTDLWVDINRPIQKLPGKGEEEYMHWDIPYFFTPYAPDEAIAGKVGVTNTKFVCSPQTHTKAEHDRICAAYQPLYPGAKASSAKFALDPKKPDPLGLASRRVAVEIPAGCVVFWSKWLLHGVQKNPIEEAIQFGFYLGYMPAVDRPEYKRKAGGISERDDRIRSYTEGRAPVLWPSLDRIHYYPALYNCFHNWLEPYLKKTRQGWPGLTTRVIKSGANKGTVVDDIVPVPDAHYVPPPLTQLGKRLLGQEDW